MQKAFLLVIGAEGSEETVTQEARYINFFYFFLELVD